MSKIELSEKSIKRVIKICDTVRSKVPKFADMAEGISKYAQEKAYLSEKQAAWVCQNALHWKLKRPEEMARVKLGTQSSAHSVGTSFEASHAPILKKILRHLHRIENMLRVERDV